MAGHSQFKNIMHRKGAQDKKRAKRFNKLAREITVAAKSGLPDPDANARLRNAISAARALSMPKDRIKVAIDLASPNSRDQSNYEEIRYEGRGPGGVSIIIEALTDNRNRTAAEVRAAFAKNGGALGETNSVTFMFDRIGQLIYPASVATFDAMFEAGVEAGAENVEAVKDTLEISCKPEDYAAVRESIERKFGEPAEAGIIWKPNMTASLNEEQATSLMDIIEALEDNDDVQIVFNNADIADDILAKLEG